MWLVLHVRSCTYAPEQQNKCPRNSPGLLSRASDAVSDDYVGESNEPGIEQPKHAVSVSGNIITATATSGGTTYLTCNPIVIVMRSWSSQQSQSGEEVYPSDFAQTTNDKPVQPNLSQFPSRQIGGKVRSCQLSWFQCHQCLEYSIVRDSCYCYPCCLFNAELSDSLFGLNYFLGSTNLCYAIQQCP